MDSGGFKAPDSTPQDLLLIHDLIGEQLPTIVTTPKPPVVNTDSDSIASSSEEDAADSYGESEDEVVSDLLKTTGDSDKRSVPSTDSESDTSSDYDSDSDSGIGNTKEAEGCPPIANSTPDDVEDDDDENGPTLAPGAIPQTKNEVIDADVNVPEVEEVGPDETLSKVGEILSILDNRAVIVKGEASGVANRGSESALDSDTLLVFDDRKVLGYVYETFGPTSQPFYQIKFNQKYPLDDTKVRIGREVFHIPERSRFVFLRDIKFLKGSDASNLYDEEPAEHELEYSDDEAEAAAKSRRKRKRGESRAGSVASSRFSTPGPSEGRGQDLNYVGGDAYAAHGPYDIDFTAVPSRPLPMPYDDDPYADTSPTTAGDEPRPSNSRNYGTDRPRIAQDHLPQRDPMRGTSRPPSRGRGRGRGQGEYPKRSRGDSRRPSRPSHSQVMAEPSMPSGAGFSFTAPPATQHHNESSFAPFPGDSFGPWGFHQPYSPSEASLQPYIQPHINPRFASMLGVNTNFAPQIPFMGFSQDRASMGSNVRDRSDQARPDWTDEWTVHGGNDGPVG